MRNIKENKNQTSNGNGNQAPEETSDNQKESKAYKSAMKAFEITHKRLFPKLYTGKSKRA